MPQSVGSSSGGKPSSNPVAKAAGADKPAAYLPGRTYGRNAVPSKTSDAGTPYEKALEKARGGIQGPPAKDKNGYNLYPNGAVSNPTIDGGNRVEYPPDWWGHSRSEYYDKAGARVPGPDDGRTLWNRMFDPEI